MFRVWTLTCVAMGLIPLPAHAADIPMQVTVTPRKATIGDRIRLEVVFHALPVIRFVAVISNTAYADWDILQEPSPPRRHPSAGGGPPEHRFVFTLIPWSATLTATPALAFNAIQPTGQAQAVLVKPVNITMESILAQAGDTSDLRPLKGVVGFRSWWPWLLGLGAVLLALAGWWLWRRRKRRAAALRVAAAPAVPPERTAREALDELLASNLLEEGGMKLFYSQLSDIFRRYVEGRFQIPALDRTTAELLPELRRRDELKSILPEIRPFLDSCDLVKFAKYVPDADDVQTDVTRVRQFVDQTSPRARSEPVLVGSVKP